MRLLLLIILLYYSIIKISSATSQGAHLVKSSSTSVISAKLPSRRSHGRTIEQLIGGHLLFNRDVYLRKRNKKIIDGNITNDRRNKGFNDSNDLEAEISLITAGAGQGKEQKNTNATKKDESKKTLAEQVVEGKYGLIHKELFQFPPKRPGVLSYKANADVPDDDVKTYGGLNDEEIWLSEDHLLVLKGGLVNKNNNQPAWKPLDSYKAPNRQVKLPANPKVPPPFPVQLTDDGPIQFIGNNQLPVYNPFTNQTVFLFSNGRVPDIKTENFNQKNPPAWNGENKNPPKFNGYQYPPPVPLPLGKSNQTFSNPFLNLPPLNLSLSPGSLDEQNSTDIDEDDPSLYYPPPYSFVYKSSYNNSVSPGPLVPGIILPPPPNFFGLLDENKKPAETPIEVLNKINGMKLRERIKNSTYSGTQRTTAKPEKISTTTAQSVVQTEPQKYDIEIEKVIVRPFPVRNDTTKLKSLQPTSAPTTTTAVPILSTKKRTRTKAPPTTRTQLHKVNVPDTSPLISLNHLNIKGNPIYFEYFDARTPVAPFHNEYSLTTVAPFISSIPTGRIPGTTTVKPPVSSHQSTKQRIPSKSYLPSKPKDYAVPDPESYRYKTMQEFNREIETIRQTLRLYEHASPLLGSMRAPKARPMYDFSYDLPQVKVPSDIPQLQSPYPGTIPAATPPHRIVPYNQKLHPATDSNFRVTPNVNQQQSWHPIVLPNPGGRPASFDTSVSYGGNHYNPYRVHALNVEITSANPHLEYSPFTTAKPSYFDQPNWYSVEKVKVLEIPKPLIYNNGASGYNQKLYIHNKYNFPAGPAVGTNAKTPQNQHYNGNGSSRQTVLKQNTKSTLSLGGDILVNYKNPLPAIHPDSEILPYNGKVTKPLIQYHLPGDKAHVYFITPQEMNYQ